MKQIQLSTGKNNKQQGKEPVYALVDDEDYEWISSFKWGIYRNKNEIYARRIKRSKGKLYVTHMHRLIMDCPEGMVVDHINHNGLDNRRQNLRVCTPAQNQKNMRPQKGRTSKYLGVCKRGNSWLVYISHMNIRHYLGSYKTEIEAAQAYDNAAKVYHGEFANLNIK